VNAVDWIAVVVIALTAISGFRRGLLTGALSLSGLVLGALAGARLAPVIVGDASPYVPLVALAGAAIGGMLGQATGGFIGNSARGMLSILPPLRWLDSAGGTALGLFTGLAMCWAVGAVLLYLPGQTELRQLVQESRVVSALTEALPPERVMSAVERIDPFATIVGPVAGVAPPDPTIVHARGVRAARPYVVRVRGYACGLGVEGSGWIVRPGLVATNAHVVAGVDRPVIDQGGKRSYSARVVSFDARNDVAILRVPDLPGRPLTQASPQVSEPAALLGFPENGPYRVTAVRMGKAAKVGTRDAYGRIQLGRTIVALRGNVESGNSGGPIVNRQGRVVAMIFAQRRGSDDGYAVPNGEVEVAVANAGPPLRTACAAR
jgi:Trypsin-like peptidase domain/Colicin V production protein